VAKVFTAASNGVTVSIEDTIDSFEQLVNGDRTTCPSRRSQRRRRDSVRAKARELEKNS
jgi:F0F1-type ATP synthase beta subunit